MMSTANEMSEVGSAAFDAATAAVEAALAAGARYADARLVDRRHESMTARDGDVRSLSQTTSAGLGVRALVGSSWGFAALGDPAGDADARRTGERATAIAAASAAVPGPAMELVAVPPVQGSWASECLEDPFAVPLAE
jgi:TldD protein